MHDAIAFLKDAVRRGPAVTSIDSCYIVEPTMIRASNDCMHAGINWPSNANFALPADAVDAFLARTREVQAINVTEGEVTFRTGRLSSKIARRHDDPVPSPRLPNDWYPSPPGLGQALKTAGQFTNESATGARLWQAGVRLWNRRVTSCSGQTAIDIELDDLELEQPKILLKAQVDFLVAQGDPDEFGFDRSTVSFRWEDGRWVRFQVVNAEMPEQLISQLFATKLGNETPVTIDDNWRESFGDAVALSDTAVGLVKDGFKAVKENIESLIELDIEVPSDHISWWNSKDLAKVIGIADAWNPLNYPDPALFIGNGFKGCIVGMSR